MTKFVTINNPKKRLEYEDSDGGMPFMSLVEDNDHSYFPLKTFKRYSQKLNFLVASLKINEKINMDWPEKKKVLNRVPNIPVDIHYITT